LIVAQRMRVKRKNSFLQKETYQKEEKNWEKSFKNGSLAASDSVIRRSRIGQERERIKCMNCFSIKYVHDASIMVYLWVIRVRSVTV